MTGSALSDAQRQAIVASRQRLLKRARERKRVGRYALQTAAIVPLVGLMRMLPVEVASNLGGWVGRRVIARLENLRSFHRTVRVAFPDISEAEADALLVEMSGGIL